MTPQTLFSACPMCEANPCLSLISEPLQGEIRTMPHRDHRSLPSALQIYWKNRSDGTPVRDAERRIAAPKIGYHRSVSDCQINQVIKDRKLVACHLISFLSFYDSSYSPRFVVSRAASNRAVSISSGRLCRLLPSVSRNRVWTASR